MTDWTKKKYNEYSEYYMPWIEDKYLAWFGENKTSYTAKGQSWSLWSPVSLSHLPFLSSSHLSLSSPLLSLTPFSPPIPPTLPPSSLPSHPL